VSEDEGLELEPVPAEPPLVPLEELGLEDAPPPDVLLSELEDEELEGEDGEVLDGELEELAAPDGLDGVVAPADEDDDGEVDDGLDDVVPVEDPEPLLLPRSQAVSRLAPSAMETAIARVESLMWPPWLGYLGIEQGLGRAARH
jgi:hypothetical protein